MEQHTPAAKSKIDHQDPMRLNFVLGLWERLQVGFILASFRFFPLLKISIFHAKYGKYQTHRMFHSTEEFNREGEDPGVVECLEK